MRSTHVRSLTIDQVVVEDVYSQAEKHLRPAPVLYFRETKEGLVLSGTNHDALHTAEVSLMRRPICDFVDLARLAEACGFTARRFTPCEPMPGANRLEDLETATTLAILLDADGKTLPVTAARLSEHITATIPQDIRDFAGWLAAAHLHCLVDDPEYHY